MCYHAPLVKPKLGAGAAANFEVGKKKRSEHLRTQSSNRGLSQENETNPARTKTIEVFCRLGNDTFYRGKQNK